MLLAEPICILSFRFVLTAEFISKDYITIQFPTILHPFQLFSLLADPRMACGTLTRTSV